MFLVARASPLGLLETDNVLYETLAEAALMSDDGDMVIETGRDFSAEADRIRADNAEEQRQADADDRDIRRIYGAQERFYKPHAAE